MNNLQKRLFLLLIILSVFTLFAGAQMIPTGKLVGTVSDDQNQPLPGVTITISSPAMILPEMSMVTNERGYYRFVELAGGSYLVKFEMPGMKTVIREDVIVTVRRTVTLNILMEQTTLDEEVLVVGETPAVDLQRSSVGTNFNIDLISTLPIQRSFKDIASLAPGIYAETSHGSDVRSNKYTIDGFNTSHPTSGQAAVDVGYDSIEEVIIDTGGHKAEYGAVRGAVIQVITKSGGNRLSGEVNAFYRNQSLQSDNTKGTPFEGRFVGFDYAISPGFALGGPVKKDKFWFFTNFNMRRQDSFIDGYPALSEQNAPVNNDFYTGLAKLTWQINPTNKIITSFFWRGDYTDHLWASYRTTLEGSLKDEITSMFITTQWQSFFSQDFIFNLRGGYFESSEHFFPKTPIQRITQLPENILTNIGDEAFIENIRYQGNAVGSYFIDNWFGAHEIKSGIDFEFSQWHNWYVFHEEERFAGKYEPGYYMYALWYYDGVPYQAQFFTDINRKTQSMQLGFFIQDTWSLSTNFTINLGVRYDVIEGRFPRQLAPGKTDEYTYEKTEKPVAWNVLTPRISLSFDPFGNGKTALKAGYSRYYAPLNLHAISYAMKGGFKYFMARLNPDFSEDYRYGQTATSDILFDPDAKAPYGDEINFGIQRELAPNFSLGITYIQKWEKRLLDRVDANGLDVDLLRSTGEVSWTGYHLVQGTDPLTGKSIEFYEMNEDKGPTVFYHTNVPGTARTYRGLEIKLEKRMSNNWAMKASYVYSKGEGIINTSFNETWTTTQLYVNPNFTDFYRRGLLENQRQHYFKLQGTYLAPLGFAISGYFQYFSGVPFTRTIRSIEAGLQLYQGTQTRNAEERGSSITPDNYLLDLRLEKRFDFGPGSLFLMLDVFNVFNSNEITSYGTRTGLDYMTPISITDPRYLRLGAAYRF